MNGRTFCCVLSLILSGFVSAHASTLSSSDFDEGQPHSNDIPASFTSHSVVNTKPVIQQQVVSREVKETNSVLAMNSTSPLSRNEKSWSTGP